MVKHDYKRAKEILNNNDLMRLVCCFLHCDYSKIDYEAAAADFGSATPHAMRVMVNTALKKLRDSDIGTDDAGADNSPATPGKAKTTPKKRTTPAKQSGSRKKTKPRYEEEVFDDEVVTKKEGDSDEGPPMLELEEGDVDPFV